jgi:hypothetical protein
MNSPTRTAIRAAASILLNKSVRCIVMFSVVPLDADGDLIGGPSAVDGSDAGLHVGCDAAIALS